MTVDLLALGIPSFKRRRDHDWIPQVPLSGGSVTFAWQFQPETYGAVGDGRVTGDVTSAGTNTYTSPTVAADPNAVGKFIMIHGANGSSSGPVIGTITTVSPGANQFTVSGSAAGASVASCPAVWGTDDTTAINAAVTAASNYAQTFTSGQTGSGSYFAEVLFSAKIYIVAGLTQTGNGSTTVTFNAQIPLPYANPNGNTQKLVIALTGAGDCGYFQYFDSIIPNVAGTALVSMKTAPSTPSATFGEQSVIGGPASGISSPGAGFTGGFANVKPVIKGIGVWCGRYTNIWAYDLQYVAGVMVRQSSAHIFAPTGFNTSGIQPWLKSITDSSFTNSISTGFAFPQNANNADVVADDVTAEGYEAGFRVYDHFTASRVGTIYCDVAMVGQGLGGTGHMITIQNAIMEAYNGGFLNNAGGGTKILLDIRWLAECAVGSVTYDYKDTNGVCNGVFRFRDPADPTRTPIISGTANVKFIWEELLPGHTSSPPSVPLTTVAAAPVYRDATVVVHTGAGVTVSAITVDGTATSQTVGAASSSVPIRVPAAKTIALTYAGGTPTWDWWYD